MRAALLALLLAAPAAAEEADSLIALPAAAPAAAAPPLRKLAEPPKDAPVLERGPAQAPASAPAAGLERREGAEKDRVRPEGAQPPADASLPRKTRAPALKPSVPAK